VFYLNEHIEHYPFNKGVSWWVDRHNKYSTMEALVLSNKESIKFGKLFSKDKSAVRSELKKILYRLPFRPAVVFIFLYVFKMGFLDGKAGFDFASLRMFYEKLIDLKIEENRKS
jgi:hypothetical protein